MHIYFNSGIWKQTTAAGIWLLAKVLGELVLSCFGGWRRSPLVYLASSCPSSLLVMVYWLPCLMRYVLKRVPPPDALHWSCWCWALQESFSLSQRARFRGRYSGLAML